MDGTPLLIGILIFIIVLVSVCISYIFKLFYYYINREHNRNVINNSNITILEQNLENECTICLEQLNEGDRIKTLQGCGHYFHAKCINTWINLNESNGCPICRQSDIV